MAGRHRTTGAGGVYAVKVSSRELKLKIDLVWIFPTLAVILGLVAWILYLIG